MDGHLLSPDSIWLWDWDSTRPLHLRPRKSVRRWDLRWPNGSSFGI